MKNDPTLLFGDARLQLPMIDSESAQLIWTDPPFNTGDTQKHSRGALYSDYHADYKGMMISVMQECYRVLAPTGSLACLLDYREVHNVKTWLDDIFGFANFRGEVIVHSELGNTSKKGWAQKHSTILWFTKSSDYLFKHESVPETLRKSPKGTYKGAKKITSVWPYTMSNTAAERVNYPNQKPLDIIRPWIEVHTEPGDLVLDPFAGSGSTGVAAIEAGRRATLIDSNEDALAVQVERFEALARRLHE